MPSSGNWSAACGSILQQQIKSQLHLRQGAALTNFEERLATQQHALAQQMLKDEGRELTKFASSIRYPIVEEQIGRSTLDSALTSFYDTVSARPFPDEIESPF